MTQTPGPAVLYIRMDRTLYRRLQSEAHRREMSVNGLVTDLVRDALSDPHASSLPHAFLELDVEPMLVIAAGCEPPGNRIELVAVEGLPREEIERLLTGAYFQFVSGEAARISQEMARPHEAPRRREDTKEPG